MSKRILLEFKEKSFNELIEKQDGAQKAVTDLVQYCESTLQIEVSNLKTFMENPAQYCIDAYWEKYGEQYKNSPVQKHKLLTLTAWNESQSRDLIENANKALRIVRNDRYEITENSIDFKRDPEDFKTYVRDEDVELYEELSRFIEMAKELEKKGGKPAWTLSRFHPGLASPNNVLIHSKSFFSASVKDRNRPLASFLN